MTVASQDSGWTLVVRGGSGAMSPETPSPVEDAGARVRLGGETVARAAQGVIDGIAARRGKVGTIAVAPDGETAMPFSTSAMYRGRIAAGKAAHVAVHAHEER